jgi:glycosyltransferase involved in cell wall biosynthesis
MEILVVTREFPPYVLGGLSYHLEHLYQEISRAGHDVTILSGKCGKSTTIDREGNNEFEMKWIPYSSPEGYQIHFPLRLYRALSDMDLDRFDVILSHTEIPFNIDVPIVMKYHDCKQESVNFIMEEESIMKRVLNSFYNPLRRIIDQRSLRFADSVIFNSKLTKDLWSDNYEITSDTNIIYNGVDTNEFYPDSSYKITDENYLLFVGDSKRKGISKVIDYADESEMPIYVAGNIDMNSNKINELGYLDQSELRSVYTDAYATIHPANFEAFGNVILESLACGTPVVTSPYCGAAEIIGNCGIVTEDIDYGVDKVGSIKTEDCVARASNFSWENVSKETIKVANRVLTDE